MHWPPLPPRAATPGRHLSDNIARWHLRASARKLAVCHLTRPAGDAFDGPIRVKIFRILFFSAAACALLSGANAQTSAPAVCPPASSMKAEQLYGEWAVRFSHPPAGLPEHAVMRLKRHAEFSESLAGSVSRELGKAAGTSAIAGHSAKAALAGDLDEGMLLLDESSDQISITGTWNGEMVADSCGTVYQGLWKDTSRSALPDAPDVPFTLTKRP